MVTLTFSCSRHLQTGLLHPGWNGVSSARKTVGSISIVRFGGLNLAHRSVLDLTDLPQYLIEQTLKARQTITARLQAGIATRVLLHALLEWCRACSSNIGESLINCIMHKTNLGMCLS